MPEMPTADFAVAHPGKPGRMVLAIEADGVSYHSSATARDRDRLRQQILEGKGWTFHRIWSTEWFRHPDAETKRAVDAWHAAMRAADRQDRRDAGPEPTLGSPEEDRTERPRSARSGPRQAPAQATRGRRPSVERGRKIQEYSHDELVALATWVRSDGRLRAEDEMLRELMYELGFKRRGERIVAALTQAIRETA